MKKILVFLLSGLLAISAAACAPKADGATSSGYSFAEGTYLKGETAEAAGCTAVLKQYIQKAGTDTAQPEVGKVFLLLEFRIDNLTDAEMPVSTQLSFKGRADGETAAVSTKALQTRGSYSTLDGTVPAGGATTGVVGFEVPEDWKVFEVDFYPDAMKADALCFGLEKK